MKAFKMMIAPLIFLLSSFSFANTAPQWALRPYVGIDAEIRFMHFKDDFGGNLLPHRFFQGNGYGGILLNSHIAVEIGYEGILARTKTVTLHTGDLVNGVGLSSNLSPANFKSKIKLKGPHVDIVGFYYFYDNSPLHLIGSIGAVNLKGTVFRQVTEFAGASVAINRSSSGSKTVLRLKGGLQYLYDDNWGVRATFGWVNTRKMTITANDGGRTSFYFKPKDSTVYDLGLFWRF